MRNAPIRSAVATLAVAIATAVPLSVASATAGTPTKSPPSITVTPDNVMVNTMTQLAGRGFQRHTVVHVVECAASSWVVMTNPCDASNDVTVETNGRGSFTARFMVRTCPVAPRPGPGGRSFLCFIGVPALSGIDTVSLQPGSSIVVTYP